MLESDIYTGWHLFFCFQFFWCCKTSQEVESRKIHWNAWRYYLLPWWTTSGGNICCLRKQKTLTSLPRIVIRLDYFQADLRHWIGKFTPTQVWATPVLLRVETSRPRSQTTPAGGDPWAKVKVKKKTFRLWSLMMPPATTVKVSSCVRETWDASPNNEGVQHRSQLGSFVLLVI